MSGAAAALAGGLSLLAALEPVQLEIRRDEAAEACPSDEELAARVRARVAADPFADADQQATRRLRVRIDKLGAQLRARVVLQGDDGALRGRRELWGALDCVALADQLVLALAIAIDPLLLTRPAPTAPRPAKPDPLDARPGPLRGRDLDYTNTDRVLARPPLEGVVPRGTLARAMLGAAMGVAQVPAPSLRAELSLDFRSWHLDGGLRFDVPVRYPTQGGGGQMDLTLVAADVSPCLPWRVAPRVSLRGCAAGQAGVLVAHGVDFERNAGSTQAWFAMGPRATAGWRVWPRVGLLAVGDVMIPFVRPRYVDLADPERLYHQPSVVTGSLGLGVELEIR